ncbi:UvrD-helicase domain-containing protein [Psychroflexus tropicus]|uniref:UvrD-helicase domain-containing protein n=1 Tax=Psychroflexus tropicus TaxID=197345 RepID=UPI0003759DF9|nr:UvrD-helicase domain-containing protein [Psychroflexus tropicus]
MQNPSNFTIYNASAGSGKTFKLTERYLTLLLSSSKFNSFQNILAITFTNKAVGEMKTRILDYLTLFSREQESLEDDPMFKLIQNTTGLSKKQIQKKSYFILKEILGNYAAFEISTIDAFTHRIIRTFAKDLGLSMNFDIEMDAKQILQLAVDRLVEKAGNDKKLTEVLIDFALDKVNDDKSGDVSRDIFEAATLLLNEKDEAYINALSDFKLEDFKTLKSNLENDIESLNNQLKINGEDFLEVFNQNGLETTDFMRGSIPNYFKKLREGHYPSKFDSAWQTQIENEESYVKKNQKAEKKQIIFSMKKLIVEKFISSKDLISKLRFYQKIQKNITQLSLLNAVKEEMELIKKEQNIMLISDFNKKISEEIKKQPAPFIFERLGEKFQHYFIDEFQDTSRLQWNNLIPLTGNALATLFEGDEPGSLTLVGDAKQSIYAWRGGDAYQFMSLSNGDSPFPSLPKLKTLDANFRSAKAIVDFNNRFFEYVGNQLSSPELKQLFSENRLIQQATKTEEGYVQLKFLEAENNDQRHQVYPKEILNIIIDKQNNGFELGEICILVRNKQEGIAIAEYLNQHQIPIVSSETLLIRSDAQVQFVLNLFNVLNNEADENSKAKVLDVLSLRSSKTEAERFELLSNTLIENKEEFWTMIPKFGFDFDPNEFMALPFYDAVEYTINKFELNESANAYLQFFLDEVFDFTIRNQAGLNAFLKYWGTQEEVKSIISSDQSAAVQIMTIHKSKGLQFPVVIFPYANQQIDNTLRNHLWVNLDEKFKLPFALITKPGQLDHPLYKEKYSKLVSELEMENINILYVALTRAAKELYILSEDDRDKKGSLKANTFSGLLMGYLEISKQTKVEANMNYSWGKRLTNHENLSLSTDIETKTLTFHSPSQDLNLNLVTTAGKLWNDELEEAKQEGNLIHSLLSKIKLKDDLKASLNWHINNGYINHKEINIYQDILQSILTHPELKAFYQDGYSVWNERDIYHHNKLLRPDRVCLLENDAYIIDYKTGHPSPMHSSQVEAYAEALRSLKYIVKKKLLVYISDSIEVKIV